jgi:hypothetical protein
MKRQSVTEAFKLLDILKEAFEGEELYQLQLSIAVLKDYITELEEKSDSVADDLEEIKGLLRTIADKFPVQLPYINNPTPPYNPHTQPWDPLNPFHITCNTQPNTQEGEKQ